MLTDPLLSQRQIKRKLDQSCSVDGKRALPDGQPYLIPCVFHFFFLQMMNVYYFHHQADELLGTASEQFLGKSVKEIKMTILQTLEGHLRAILGKLQEIKPNLISLLDNSILPTVIEVKEYQQSFLFQSSFSINLGQQKNKNILFVQLTNPNSQFSFMRSRKRHISQVQFN